MFEIIDFSSWKIFDGFAEGSGRSEKVWLISETGQTGLFKYPKIDPKVQKETTEHISEHLAHQLGEILGVPTANVDIGIRNGRIGSMSYLVRKADESLIEGIGFISGRYPQFNAETMQDEASGTYYCIDHIFNSVPKVVPQKIWIEMMIFDFLIGNRDRHQSNWGLFWKVSTDEKIIKLRRCPLYDNGSSLCCYVNEHQLAAYDGRDSHRFDALVDSKSKSMIRIDGSNKKLPSHSTVVKYLLREHPDAESIANNFIARLNQETINTLLDQYPDTLLPSEKNQLIRRYLFRKTELLASLLTRKDDSSVAK